MPAAFTKPRPPAAFITASEVARMIGFDSATAFLRERVRLQDDHDFPLPMPTSRNPLKWRRSQVQGWTEAMGRAPSIMAADPVAPASPVARTPRLAMLSEARTA